MRRVIFDIETDGLLDDVKTLWCIVCRDADTGEVTTYGPDQATEGVNHLLSSDELIGRNIINYDIPRFKLEKLPWPPSLSSIFQQLLDLIHAI